MKKLKRYAITGGALFATGAVLGLGLQVSGSDAGKTPTELAHQRATLGQVLFDEVNGRLTDKNDPFAAARFITKSIPADLNISNPKQRRAEADGRVSLILDDTFAATGARRGKSKQTDVIHACGLWALQSGLDNLHLFQDSTLNLYAAAPDKPENYDIVRDRCLGSLAGRLADRKLTTLVYPWKVA